MGKMPKAGIAVGPLDDFAGQKIVGLGGAAAGRRGIALDLHAGPGYRQHRARDAGAVHGLKPRVAEILQAREQPAHGFLVDTAHGGQPIILKARTQEMLFEGDFAHRIAPGVRSTLRQLLYRIPAILYQSGVQAARIRAQRG